MSIGSQRILPPLVLWMAWWGSLLQAEPAKPFSTLWVQGSAGWVEPVSNLRAVLDGSPSLGFGLETPYYRHWNAAVHISYSRPHTDRFPIHFGLGQLAIRYLPTLDWVPSMGGGTSLYFVRGASEKVPARLLLADNESEFGFFFMLSKRVFQSERIYLSPVLVQHLILTQPQRSHFLEIRCEIGWRTW